VQEENHLSIHSDMTVVIKAMANPESGLEVRDRMWLKITIPSAFIGKKTSSRFSLDAPTEFENLERSEPIKDSTESSVATLCQKPF